MGRRSGYLEHEDDVMAATLAAIDAQIAHDERRAASPLAANLRKSAASHAYWLRKLRARHPEVNDGGS